MSETQNFPYMTKLDILYQPLERIEEKKVADECPHQWFNQSLCEVNGSVVRLGVVQGGITGTNTRTMTSSSMWWKAVFSSISKIGLSNWDLGREWWFRRMWRTEPAPTNAR